MILANSQIEFAKAWFRSMSATGGSGSGVVLSKDGLVVTNAHVVSGKRGQTSGRKEIRVVLPDGSDTAAKLLAKDDDLDVAILQVEKPAEGDFGLSPI